MKVIRIRVGALAASCGLLASLSALTVITTSPAAAGTVGIASGSSSPVCPNATVIGADRCMPV
jgi:hypothetical protein